MLQLTEIQNLWIANERTIADKRLDGIVKHFRELYNFDLDDAHLKQYIVSYFSIIPTPPPISNRNAAHEVIQRIDDKHICGIVRIGVLLQNVTMGNLIKLGYSEECAEQVNVTRLNGGMYMDYDTCELLLADDNPKSPKEGLKAMMAALVVKPQLSIFSRWNF